MCTESRSRRENYGTGHFISILRSVRLGSKISFPVFAPVHRAGLADRNHRVLGWKRSDEGYIRAEKCIGKIRGLTLALGVAIGIVHRNKILREEGELAFV